MVVGRLVLEPGWRWSEHVRPIAGTTSCQFHHVGLALSGAMDGRMDDGTEFEVRPGDVFDVPPGHDNWVIGDEPMTAVIWGGWRGWGKPPVGERILTTMLLTDIAGSTDRAAAVGDAAWDQLLDRHHALVREILERYRETARIMALGNAGDILVSSTTRELSADSGFSYVDRGIHHLKGIPAPRRIFLLDTSARC
jgi:hypothetical protein